MEQRAVYTTSKPTVTASHYVQLPFAFYCRSRYPLCEHVLRLSDS